MTDLTHDTHASACPHCGAKKSPPTERFSLDWRRTDDDKRIAGVCGGLAREFGIPAALLRLGFVLATIFAGGVGLVIYAALWVIMAPDRSMGRGVMHHEQGHERPKTAENHRPHDEAETKRV